MILKPKHWAVSLGLGASVAATAHFLRFSPGASALLGALSFGAILWPILLTKRAKIYSARITLEASARQDLLRALHTRIGPSALPLPPLGHMCISLDFAERLTAMILERRPARMVEFGSGSSTVLAAAALRQLGAGKLYSFDHEADYAAQTRAELARRGLSDWAEVQHAPLVPHPTLANTLTYSPELWQTHAPYDLAVVDGPPIWVNGAHRSVLMGLLTPHLNPGAELLFDDGARAEITQGLKTWAAQHPRARLAYLPFEKGAWHVTLPTAG
jgi:predicted O-methyltransferase YrrM